MTDKPKDVCPKCGAAIRAFDCQVFECGSYVDLEGNFEESITCLRNQLAKAEEHNKNLLGCLNDMENDMQCLPEDQSVTETVGALRDELAKAEKRAEKAEYLSSSVERLMSKMKTIPGSFCWEWTGAVGSDGYGRTWFNGKSWMAHRLSYHLMSKPWMQAEIPEGMFVCHECDNPLCINPGHLFVGSADDNNKDMARKGRARGPLGESNGNSKLTKEDVLMIVQSVRGGSPVAEVASEFGVTPNNIKAICDGTTWSHITGIDRILTPPSGGKEES